MAKPRTKQLSRCRIRGRMMQSAFQISLSSPLELTPDNILSTISINIKINTFKILEASNHFLIFFKVLSKKNLEVKLKQKKKIHTPN